MSANGGSGGKPQCPRCGGVVVWKNGTSRAGKQQYRCRDCARVFVAEPHLPKVIKEIADRMLQEEFPVPDIARVLSGHVSRRWLYNRRVSYVSSRYQLL